MIDALTWACLGRCRLTLGEARAASPAHYVLVQLRISCYVIITVIIHITTIVIWFMFLFGLLF